MTIQVYRPGNCNFDYDGGYNPKLITCELKMELKGEWVVTLRNSLDENMKGIAENAILCMDTPIGKRQPFIISEMGESDGFTETYTIPIFLTNDIYFFGIRIVNKAAQDALNIIFEDTKYKGYSDISKVNSACYQEMCANETISGDNDNASLNRWGDEPIYKNYEIYLNKRTGADDGMRAEFGFNLTGVEEKIGMSGVITRIRPKAYNGYMLPSSETVDSPNTEKYESRRFPPIVFEYTNIKLKGDAQEDDKENGVTICDIKAILYQKLQERAKREYMINKVDMPIITCNVQMVDPSKTDLYREHSELVRMSLGDMVHVSHRRLEIRTTPRVIELVYDGTTDSVTSLMLGDHKKDYFDRLSKTRHIVDTIYDKMSNTIMAQCIAGVVNLMMTSLEAQKNTIKRQDVHAILSEDTNRSSPAYGALCIGTRGVQITKKRNEAGTDWRWGTTINFEATNVDRVIIGIPTDGDGEFYLNLDTGELRMKDGSSAGTISGATINGSETTRGTIEMGNNFSAAKDEIMRCANTVIKDVTMESGIFKGKFTTKYDACIGRNLHLSCETGRINQITFGGKEDTVIILSEGLIRIGIPNNNTDLLSKPSISITKDDIFLNLNEDNHIHINSVLGVTMKTKGKFVDMSYDI